MKRLTVLLLFAATLAVAQKQTDNGSREYRMAPGVSVAVRFSPNNPNLKTATYHIKSDLPVTVFFTRNFDLRTSSKRDTLLRLAHAPCMFSNISNADVSCDNPDNDTLLIYDTRDSLDKTTNVVLLDLKHYSFKKKASN